MARDILRSNRGLITSNDVRKSHPPHPELKRRTRVVGAFPSDQSLMRLGVSILIDINEDWMTTRKYLSMDMD
jgi:transposase-like protein